MPAAVPASRPQARQAAIERLAWEAFTALGNETLPGVFVVGVRGYYRDTMGKPGVNDRGIYDDAVFVFGPDTFAAFNANVDPSAWRPKVASLKPGVHWFREGRHGISRDRPGKIVSYPAFRPATKGEALPVTRDGVDVPWPGVAINIHRGGVNSTSSEGCQTLPPSQWPAFQSLLSSLLKRHGQKLFPYILLTGPIP